jgi:hypothetical protein
MVLISVLRLLISLVEAVEGERERLLFDDEEDEEIVVDVEVVDDEKRRAITTTKRTDRGRTLVIRVGGGISC